MGLKKYAAKIDDYLKRQKQGKVEKIKPSHVKKVISKLQAKAEKLEGEIEKATKDSKKARLERKVLIANQHIMRAEMLLREIDPKVKHATKERTADAVISEKDTAKKDAAEEVASEKETASPPGT